jgi:iron complex outermembrane receptor protein
MISFTPRLRAARLVPALAAAVLAFLGRPALAQQHGGDVRGTVTDARTRTPIIGARVAVVTPARVAMTDQRGTYTLRELPAGTYVVTTSAIGRKADTSSVTVTADGTTTLDVSLQEGSLLLSSVVVSATRTQVEAAKVASTVNVLTPEQVRQSPARESQDLLREIPAVELPRTSSLVGGTAQIVSIRGVDEGRTAVLADGIPINDAWGEWIDWGRVPKAMLDRVEVVEGGTSSLYGNGAMGGVISYFTRPLSPGAVQMQVDAGSRDARHGFVAAGLPAFGAFSANVSGDYQEGGGYNMINNPIAGSIDNVSQVIQRNAFGRINYAPSSRLSAFVGGHLFGDSRNTGTPLSFQKRDQRDISAGLDWGQYSASTGMLGIRAWDGRQIENQRSAAFRSAATRAAEDSSLTAEIPSHDWGASAIWTRTKLSYLESFSVGADFRHYQGDFNEIDYSTGGCPASPTCGDVSRTVSSGGSQNLSGIFAQAIFAPWTPLRVELSARGDRWDNNDGHAVDATPTTAPNTTAYGDSSKSAFSPRVGLRYQLFSSFSLHAAYYRAFRAPNLAELYRKQVSPTQVTIPNPYLSAENAEGREAGFDWQPLDWVQLKGTWYVADYNNFNSPQTLPATGPKPAECPATGTCRQRKNVGKARSEGGEAYLALRPIPELFLSAGVNYDDDRVQSGIAAGTSNDDKPHFNRVPSPKQTIRATYSSAMIGDWTVIWRHEGTTTTLFGTPLAPYTVADANVQRELVPGLRGFVSVENITDANYQVNISGANTAASPLIVSRGLPRTIRVGVEAYRF